MKNSTRSTKKDNSKRKGIPQMKLVQRRQDDIGRQEAYNSLTTKQKLALLDSRPGESKKERMRILESAK